MSLKIFKNKHLILAMFVAPVLAVIAWLAVDYSVSEKPHSAIQGTSYKLAANANCRYQSGSCTLENGDINIQIHANRIQGNEIAFDLVSAIPIQHAVISGFTESHDSEPVIMKAGTKDHNNWRATLFLDRPEETFIRLAVSIAGTRYYAETPAIFIDYETSFSRENFSK